MTPPGQHRRRKKSNRCAPSPKSSGERARGVRRAGRCCGCVRRRVSARCSVEDRSPHPRRQIEIFRQPDPRRRRRTRRHAPAGALTRRPWDRTPGAAVWGQRRLKMAVSDLGAGPAAPGGLRMPPPSPGSWRTEKNTETTINRRTATCGSRWGPSGSHGSDPLRP